MCMAALPGPAELQVHFEKVHNESGDGDQIDGEDQVSVQRYFFDHVVWWKSFQKYC